MSKGKFKLEIDIGNDAMDRPWDIASILGVVSEQLRHFPNTAETHIQARAIMDTNGNTVGVWSLDMRGEDDEGEKV